MEVPPRGGIVVTRHDRYYLLKDLAVPNWANQNCPGRKGGCYEGVEDNLLKDKLCGNTGNVSVTPGGGIVVREAWGI